MLNKPLKDQLARTVLPSVRMPAQYVGGELNMVRKDHSAVRGRLCLAFPDLYTIGMSHHGLHLLYALMNARDDWACERAYTPDVDMEQALREHHLPLYSLETFTPLKQFDVLGFSLQYELCYSNILTMLDLSGIPLRSEQRTMEHPLVIAGGPCAQNPEPLAPFMDVFVTGDGEASLPHICDLWLQLIADHRVGQGRGGARERMEALAELAATLPFCYVPRFYEPEYRDGRLVSYQRLRPEVPETIEPALLRDLDAVPLPTRPLVPYVECVHDRIAIEIMRGCPWQCRFCQSTAIKRPLRFRSVDSIVQNAWESYLNSGFSEISLLSLSSSDYPHFEELVHKLRARFGPLGVSISVPSLRVNEHLRSIAELIGNTRRSSLTLAPEVARDDMRTQIRKRIRNDDLYEGCRVAFRNHFESVKLYFMCGLPGERPVDLDGIIEMSETIARIGKEERGRYPTVTASVSNFVPKAHTPYQWNVMQTREYLRWAHDYLWRNKSLRCVQLKRHSIETSLLEGVFSRGDRRVAEALELAWQRGARLDGWTEHLQPQRWWTALQEAGINVEQVLHEPFGQEACLPWDHIRTKYGRAFLEKEQLRSTAQLEQMRSEPSPS